MRENVRDLHLPTDDRLGLCPQVIENGRFVEHADDGVAFIQNWNMAETALLHLVREIAQPVGQAGGLDLLAQHADRTGCWRFFQIAQQSLNLIKKRFGDLNGVTLGTVLRVLERISDVANVDEQTAVLPYDTVALRPLFDFERMR